MFSPLSNSILRGNIYKATTKAPATAAIAAPIFKPPVAAAPVLELVAPVAAAVAAPLFTLFVTLPVAVAWLTRLLAWDPPAEIKEEASLMSDDASEPVARDEASDLPAEKREVAWEPPAERRELASEPPAEMIEVARLPPAVPISEVMSPPREVRSETKSACERVSDKNWMGKGGRDVRLRWRQGPRRGSL